MPILFYPSSGLSCIRGAGCLAVTDGIGLRAVAIPALQVPKIRKT